MFFEVLHGGTRTPSLLTFLRIIPSHFRMKKLVRFGLWTCPIWFLLLSQGAWKEVLWLAHITLTVTKIRFKNSIQTLHSTHYRFYHFFFCESQECSFPRLHRKLIPKWSFRSKCFKGFHIRSGVLKKFVFFPFSFFITEFDWVKIISTSL